MKNQYISHFGKKGMNWGLRTSQPYGTGYIRKDGKRGIERIAGDSSLADPEFVDPNEDSEFELYSPYDFQTSEEEHQKSDKRELFKFIRKTVRDDLEVNRLELAKDAIRAGEAAIAYTKTFMNDRRISELESDAENEELKIKDRHWTEEEDMAAVNPSYRNFDANTKSNCMLCTTTYDLRRRGYDVTAEKASRGYYTNEIRRWYPDAKTKNAYTASTYDDVLKAARGKNTECTQKTVKAILKQPDGARGNLTVTWGAGGGHSVVYEVKNRQVIIRDCQTNKTYKGDKVSKILDSCTSAEYTRLDNVRVDKKAVSEVIKG